MATEAVPVLIVGGGPTGLAASLSLSQLGVESLLVEKHESTTPHPKATVVNGRTAELMRQWGIDRAVEQGGIAVRDLECICWATSLAGFEIGRMPLRLSVDQLHEAALVSPAMPAMCPQDVIEPIMREAAEAHPGARVEFGIELVDLELGDDGITAEVLDRRTGRTNAIEAAYLVACDGRASPIRDRLGIGLAGREPLGQMVNIFVRADLTELVAGRLAPLYWIVNPDTPGVFITLNGTDRWLFNIPVRIGAGERPADYDDERCLETVRRAIGDDTIEIELLGIDPWTMTRLVAERFRGGRAFLAGDSAHQFPPTGGHGMNSGIHDAHNLAWKLAAVLDGSAGDALLDSYEQERRPVAVELTAESVKNAESMRGEMRVPPEVEHDTDEGRAIRELIAGAVTKNRGHFVSTGLAFGLTYRSSAIVEASPVAQQPGAVDADRELDVEHYSAVPLPGHRAPHVWLQPRAGAAPADDISVLDLAGSGFVVLTGSAGDAWVEAAGRVADDLGVAMRAHAIGAPGDLGDAAGRFPSQYRLAPDGAVLIRPDGYIGWRVEAASSDPDADLTRALSALLSR